MEPQFRPENVRQFQIDAANFHLQAMYRRNLERYFELAAATVRTREPAMPPAPREITDKNYNYACRNEVYGFWNALSGAWARPLYQTPGDKDPDAEEN